MPPVKVFWYDGMTAQPNIDGVPNGELLGDGDFNGSLFVGSRGMVTTGCLGDRTRLVPAAKMKGYKLPAQVLTRSPGHYADWIRACKGGEPACSNFSVAGPFAQWVLMGLIALKIEGPLHWDAAGERFSNSAEANRHLKPRFRRGWRFV